MRNPLRWISEEVGAMGVLAVVTAFALVSWVYWADVVQTRAQLLSFFGLVVGLAVAFGLSHHWMNRTREEACLAAKNDEYHLWRVYRINQLEYVRRELAEIERRRFELADLYARTERGDDNSSPDAPTIIDFGEWLTPLADDGEEAVTLDFGDEDIKPMKEGDDASQSGTSEVTE